MSTSKSWDVNRHTARCTSAVSVVWQCKLVSGWGLRKQRSAPPHGPFGSGRTLEFTLLYVGVEMTTDQWLREWDIDVKITNYYHYYYYYYYYYYRPVTARAGHRCMDVVWQAEKTKVEQSLTWPNHCPAYQWPDACVPPALIAPRHTNTHTDTHTHRQRDRETDRQTHKHTYTDRQTVTETHTS